MTSSKAGVTRRRYRAELRCGRTLFYEWAHFVPAVGESVPCDAHGYCAVALSITSPRPAEASTRSKPRTPDELLEYMDQHEVARLGDLRRRRFSLRLVAIAERSGALEVDWVIGVARTRQTLVPT